MQTVLVEVRQFLCTSSVSADSLQCHFGMEGSHPFDYYKPFQGVFLSQPSPFYAQETQLIASSLLGHHFKSCKLIVLFPPLECMKPLLWPYWQYSRQGACWNVLAVPDLLASP
jgi:hypothetical protein